MTTLAELVDQHACRVHEVRTIARGIYDAEERRNLLGFIADSERLARALNARDHGVVMPVRTMLNSR